MLFTNDFPFTIKGGMKTMTVGVRMSHEMREKLKKIADKEMRSLSNLILKILTEHLQEYEKSPKK
jgi:predicted DNA-binding protein